MSVRSYTHFMETRDTSTGPTPRQPLSGPRAPEGRPGTRVGGRGVPDGGRGVPDGGEPGAVDRRRARGDRTRRIVLDEAVQEASVRGLDALSLGGLAASAPVNKSAIAGLFGSKEGLQLAVVARAREIYTESVVEPARGVPRGLPRLRALTDRWIDYSRRRVFRGGCFFRTVEVEFDMRPGPVRDAVIEAHQDWEGYLVHQAALAVEAGDLAPRTDPHQVAFELNALLNAANDRSLLFDDDAAYTRTRAAVETLLTAHGAPPEPA